MAKIWIPPSEMWGDEKWVYDPVRKVFMKEKELILLGREGIPYDEALEMLED
ncbi:MAG: hypothetical protein V3V63_02505 [Candidatus Hydrothermarchaeaceae archaeon]|jgi:hypothetical protein